MPNKTIVAILCLTAILITCLIKDVDGYLIYSIGSMIAILGGYSAYKAKKP
ncbi:hypothetical protein ES703_119035 [subsurface metagenome]